MALKDVNGLSDDDRFGFSAALLGIGGVSLIFATRSLFFEDPIEVAWRSRHSSGSPSASSLPFRHFAFTPMHSGGGISFRAVF